MQLRIARHTERLVELVAFYRDGMGLKEVGGFRDHDGYSGVFLEVPGTCADGFRVVLVPERWSPSTRRG